MKIKYTGPCPEVEVEPHEGATFLAKRNEPVDVPKAVADSLLTQSTWEAAAAPPAPKSKEK